MIKVIAFDFAGVVVGSPLKSWFEKNGYDKKLYKEITQKWDIGEITLAQSFVLLSKVLPIDAEKVYEEIFQQTQVDKSIVRLVKKLKKNYKVVLFSNNSSELVRLLLKQNNALDLFDDLFISSEHKLIKPDSAYFHKMLSILDITPSEIIFTDDNQKFVKAGNAIGVKSFLFINTEKLESDLKHENIVFE